jgi:shikimate kinase
VPGHVVLVGLMGSGKSTIGRRLARLLDRPFVDADDAVEASAGQSIADLFAAPEGEAGFRDLEAATLGELLDDPEATVIAAGGGAVVTAGTRRRLADPAVTVVWLDAAPAFLASRAKARPHRPLLADADPRATLERLHGERAPLYGEVADLVVDVEPFHDRHEQPKQALAERIAELVTAHEARTAGVGP